MTIWLLALILLACLPAVGYNQGAIRVGISFFGILISALLAVPLARLTRPILSIFGVVNPVLLWVLGPFVAFVALSIIFKIAAHAAHVKVDVFYRYKKSDLQQALFKRLNTRIGVCLGLLNALAYLVLISWVVWCLSYWTIQVTVGEDNPKMIRLVNQMGRDLHSTGMDKVARAIDSLSPLYYHTADFAGLIFQNPLLEARLARYPGLLTLGERQEFQAVAHDQALSEMRVRQAPLREVLDHPSVKVITSNPETLKTIWDIVTPDLEDLNQFMETGESKHYDDKILGRWVFDANAAAMAYRRTKPTITAGEMLKIKQRLQQSYIKAMLVMAPNHEVYGKNLPKANAQGGTDFQNVQGNWKTAGSEYVVGLGSLGERPGKIDNGRLILSGEGLTLVFLPED